jgi:outer membrane protein TolC
MKQKIYIILVFCIIASPPSKVSCEDKKLNIRDLITHALENNLQLKVDRVSRHIQKDKVDAANTIFDPSIEAEASIANNSTKTFFTGNTFNKNRFFSSISAFLHKTSDERQRERCGHH